MKYYNKQWHQLFEYLGTVDMYEPVIDKDYTDQDIEELYEDMMDKYVEEDRAAYDEPPMLMYDMSELDPEDFDPQEYIIGDFDEDGGEHNLRYPENYEEFMEYQKKEFEFEMKEYENRPPFDEEESREDFKEGYNESLEEPDEDLPDWVREAVDPRLLAMNLIPEGIYKQLMEYEREKQEIFDALDEAADRALEEAAASIPDEYQHILEDLDELDGDDVIAVRRDGDELTIELVGWDFEGSELLRKAVFDKAEIIEDEGLSITAERDEDGDIVSNCSFVGHEVYFEDGRLEVHLMFDNDDELKYLTLKCKGFSCTEERIVVSDEE